MTRSFHLAPDPVLCGRTLFGNQDISLEPGTTALIGCNGSGKTTLLRAIAETLEKENVPYLKYNNLTHGGSHSIESAAYRNDTDFFATGMLSSEGELIVMNIGHIARQLGSLVRDETEKRKEEDGAAPFEIWLLLDAVDSGLSADNAADVRKYLFDVAEKDIAEQGGELYTVIAVNSYAFAEDAKCFSVNEGRYIDIGSYGDFRNAVYASREYKDRCEGIL